MESEETIFTGERVIPGAVESDLWNEHAARYRYASLFAANKHVLDVGCGTGYGAAMMAGVARDVAGFDVSPEAVEYANRHYGDRVQFSVGAASAFPARSTWFDLVTAFEVIEHIAEWPELIKEAARVLKPTGMFLVSTPNKVQYQESRRDVGANPFHIHEFELGEFREALGKSFRFVRILAQNQQSSVVVSGEEAGQYGEVFVENKPTLQGAQFFLAVCSFQRVAIPSFAYIPSGSNLLQEREQYIASLQRELEDAQWQHQRLMREHERLHQHLNERTDWAHSLEQRAEMAEAREAALLRAREQWKHEKNLIRSSRWFQLGESLNLGPKLPDDPA